MSSAQNGKTLPDKITDHMVAALVSNALRQEHARSDSAIKRIGRVTGANANSICKWYQGRNAPKSAHLMMLARSYPSVLQLMLEMIGHVDLERVGSQQSIAQQALEIHSPLPSRQQIYSDRFVTITAVVDLRIARQFNQRQLWFLGRLQSGIISKMEDIISVWHVTTRTARRDISGLVGAELVKFTGGKKNGRYKLA